MSIDPEVEFATRTIDVVPHAYRKQSQPRPAMTEKSRLTDKRSPRAYIDITAPTDGVLSKDFRIRVRWKTTTILCFIIIVVHANASLRRGLTPP
jgi:hypothetical protein